MESESMSKKEIGVILIPKSSELKPEDEEVLSIFADTHGSRSTSEGKQFKVFGYTDKKTHEKLRIFLHKPEKEYIVFEDVMSDMHIEEKPKRIRV